MNPYKILGTHAAMTPDELHDKYIELARQYHPDVESGDKQHFAVITGAYALLKNPKELKKFMEQLKAIGKLCVVCKGKGAVFKQKGMTSRTAMACKECDGLGIILRKGSSV